MGPALDEIATSKTDIMGPNRKAQWIAEKNIKPLVIRILLIYTHMEENASGNLVALSDIPLQARMPPTPSMEPGFFLGWGGGHRGL